MRGGQHGRRVGGRRWFTVAVAAAAVAAGVAVTAWPRPAAAKPGVVTNRQGETFSGEVTEDEHFVFVDSPGGQLRIDKRNVAKVDYAADVDAQYQARHAKLSATDVAGRVDLANWANQHARPDLAAASLEEARQLDPANRSVALALDSVQRQMDLDRRRGRGGRAATRPSTKPAMAAGTGPATAPPVSPPEHRLLTMDEVNAIRQVEMPTGDPLVKVRLENKVEARYLKLGMMSPAQFRMLSGEEQALEILRNGTPDMAKDVRILTDPTPLQLFKVKVMPIIAMGCASTACHGGTHGGNFALYTGDGTQPLYSNFYILQTYAARIGGVKYLAMDREVPERSLALQFGLPTTAGRPPHPTVAAFRPRFKDRDDPAYKIVKGWLTDSLRVIQPDYGFNVSAALLPTTNPAAAVEQATGVPTPPPLATTRPTPAHGTPLPRLPDGAVTQPSAP